MSMFRSKKLDLGCFINIKVMRDHTKRQVFAEHEPERSISLFSLFPLAPQTHGHSLPMALEARRSAA